MKRDDDSDTDAGPASSERAPKGRHVSVSHSGKVTAHETPEAAKQAQDAHHSAAMARHHKTISDVMKSGGNRR